MSGDYLGVICAEVDPRVTNGCAGVFFGTLLRRLDRPQPGAL